MMKILKILFLLLLLSSCEYKEQFRVSSFKVNDGWGYFITYQEKIIIRQTVIPSLSSQSSFKNEKDALKVGDLVRDRLQKKILPTVTKKDLILLKIPL